MSTRREWKPGDMAVVTVLGAENVRVFRADDGWVDINNRGVFSFTFAEDVTAARPLVVVDPENREDVRRLVDALSFETELNLPNRVQAALREYANPEPKLEEPLGLGAVVEDEVGDRLVRVDNSKSPWFIDPDYYRWDELTVVRILSEGWTE